MGHSTCVVVNCKNKGRDGKVKFYRFPMSKHRIDQRQKWIAAVRRLREDGSQWQPKPDDRICSAHFTENKKSVEPLNPSYVPVKFPEVYLKRDVNENALINRHKRFKKFKEMRKKKETIPSEHLPSCLDPTDTDEPLWNNESNEYDDTDTVKFMEVACKAETFLNQSKNDITMVSERYIYVGGKSDACTQTDIYSNSRKIICDPKKKMCDKSCGDNNVKTFCDVAVGPNLDDKPIVKSFQGFSSLKKPRQILDLAGVSFSSFQVLLKIMDNKKCREVSKKNRLFIFLVKLKTGLTFSAIGVLFSVDRSTVQRIFSSVLLHLSAATKNFVFWPRKFDVKATLPECFKSDYNDVRVIIDCTGFKIQILSKLENRVWCYSHYKHGFTAKVLVGITPSGFISFKSRVAGGRKSDSQITIESGLVNLLEDGDVVLADKGFPEIKPVLDKSGKNAFLIMPPFLERRGEFTKEETEETYKIASVRVHVERIMQRLRVYQILNQIPHNFFPHIDNILHVCCVLVNLQPPIFADEEKY